MINVTKPFLPPIEEYQRYIAGIWERQWLTNNGPLVNELELKLKSYFGLPHFLYLTNGTVALQIAIKALGLKGDIITTPFSYVATTSSIVWENCRPVFVDIQPKSFNIDPAKIVAAITKDTTAILATHVFGNPCDIETIDEIAKLHELKVIYDGAHGFGTKYKGESIFAFGDIVASSFHATKLYHTVEGGGVFTKRPELLRAMSLMRNFGHNGFDSFEGVGINGKNSEFHAAMGLVNLNHINDVLARRKQMSQLYDNVLVGLHVERQLIQPNASYNFSYYPILFPSEEILLKSVAELNLNWIYPRRYFYPSLNTLDYVDKFEVPIAEDISKRILCLPLYDGLSTEEIDFIARILLRIQNN